jgi:hypothetical protein
LLANPIFRVPFFLDKVLEEPVAGTGKSVVEAYLRMHAGVQSSELPSLRDAAFQLYRHNKSRTFALDSFLTLVGRRLSGSLLASGAVEASGGLAQFSHHLIHDYLAAEHVAAHEILWDSDTLDILSFKGAAFDSIAAVLEVLDQERASKFLRAIYDWNLYAAGYSLAEATARQTGKIARDMEEIVYAMLAEKRFDVFIPTAKRADDALLLIKTDRARDYYQSGKYRRHLPPC